MALSTKSSFKSYLALPFSLEIPQDSFFQFLPLSECLVKCAEDEEEIIKCRTIGILYSDCGRYYLKDLEEEIHIRISVKYLSSPIKSTIIPYPVQVFGELQWKKRPVIFVKILQTLRVATALRMVKTLQSITETYKAPSRPWCNENT